ncbi:SCO-spondin-like [Orbicella faveolata]|uniref:SCO-spondin-like n=1 Tax=Orbicella faveolata TaxID=48498 RepID=UPI0009E5ECB2|nr:SCO-spondin-like [Orbicella faveolata]
MGCEKLVVLVLVCLVNEMASEPRLRLSWGRRRRYCHKTNCVPGSWSSWSACSHSCGPHGTQYSRRPIIKPAQCGGTCVVTTHGARACNRFCLNGGTLIRLSCHCKYGYSGECCEKGQGKDGGWSSWSRWGQCSSSCGTGLQTRKRSCTNPPPSYGGKTCVGPAEQHKNCLLKKCPDGGWSSWSSWGQCTGYCGTGLQTRKRSCTNPPPGYGGKKCVGPTEQHKNCLLHRCPGKNRCYLVNGGWSTWGPWSKCSKTCGYGSQYSKRYCNNPSPGYGGKPCTGKDTRTRGCLVKSCPVNGGWSSWGKWCACSKPCGTGSQYRNRACTRPPPSYRGKQCTGQDKETRNCNTHHCPVDGGWSNWGNWGTCTRTCGNGKQYSKRHCDNPAPKYGGKKCYGTNVKTRACNLKPCPVNGRWSLWAAWSACTKTCGTGSKTRHRTCTNPPPKHGGVCIGPSVQTKTCAKQNCPSSADFRSRDQLRMEVLLCAGNLKFLPINSTVITIVPLKIILRYTRNHFSLSVNGRWALWEVWSTCSKTCGYGTRIRKRTCSNPPPQNGGKMCTGPSQQTGKCYLTKTCPINGRWSPWGKWCKCSKTCGTGIQTRKRTCSNPSPQHGGKPCKGISEQTKSCQLKQCPGYGGWGSWGQWSACTKTCGTGTQNRKRTCLGSGNGNCPGSNEESRHCNTQSCPVDGGWGDWSDWSACSVSCRPGTSIRSRQCNNPAPSAGGKQCTGLPVGNKPCNEGPCPVDGGWGDWSDWSACSVSCGPGTSIRSRQCNNPAPSAGGKQCTGLPVGNKPCDEGPCPVDGGWGDWTDWSACSASCGPGTSIRSRQCNNPPPGPGGKQCTGLPVGNRPCNEVTCPGSGDCWGDWSDWSMCTKACDCGKTYRVRFCKCAHGQGHEKCQGPGESSQSCHCNPCPNGPPSDDIVEA